MGLAPATPDWPTLGEREVARVLAHHGLSLSATRWHSPRPFSSAALVDVGGPAPVFVKRHATAVRAAPALRVEHSFAAHLRRGGVPVPAVVPTTAGDTVVEDPGWTYEVHEAATGEDRYRQALSWTPYDSLVDAASAGAALARLHAAAADFDLPARPTGVLLSGVEVASDPDALAALRRRVGTSPALGRWLGARRWEDEVAPLLEGWSPAPPATSWGHGDWHPTNLMWTGPDVAGVIDLGLANRTSPSFDVAVAIERSGIGWLEVAVGRRATVDLDGIRALVDGYRSVAPLDLAAVVRSLPLCHVDFALAELEHFAGVTHSSGNARLAWDGYLLGHLRWWSGPDGRRLLGSVEGLA